MKTHQFLFFLLFILVADAANAVTVNYTLVSHGGGSYQYEYTVANNGSLGAGVAVEWFDILFDTSLYDRNSLVIVTPDPPASDWDEAILGSGLLVPAAYDAYALGGGIPDGESASGFVVQFDWLGAGLPGVQAFEVYDPSTSAVVYQGTTQAGTHPEVVPLPSALVLFLSSAVLLATSSLKRWLFR